MNESDSSNNKTALLEGTQWLKTAQVLELYPIGKTLLYSLADFAGGPLATSEIRQRGKTRGIRLWDRQSIDAFIESSRTLTPATKAVAN